MHSLDSRTSLVESDRRLNLRAVLLRIHQARKLPAVPVKAIFISILELKKEISLGDISKKIAV